MKIKALDSFSTAELGMVHAGEVVDVSEVSRDRLEAWGRRGLISEILDADEAPTDEKAEPAVKNKMEAAPQNKGKRNAKQG